MAKMQQTGGVIMKTTNKFFEEGKKSLIEGNIKESIESFSNAISEGEKSDILFLSRGVAYLKNRDTDHAIDDFSEVVKMSDKNARAHYYRGIAYLTKENFKEAISEFDKTISLDPENSTAFFARGTAYAHIGDDEMAAKNIKTAITFSESGIYQLQETIGLWRTQFDKAMSIMTGEKKSVDMVLSEDESRKVKKWLKEGYEG